MEKNIYIHPEVIFEPLDPESLMDITPGSQGAGNGDGEGDYAKQGTLDFGLDEPEESNDMFYIEQ